MNYRSAVCCAIVSLGLAPVAHAGEGLRLGVQGGIGQWEMNLNVPLLSRSETLDPDFAPAVGVVGQYIFQDSGQDYFVGFEAAVAQENLSHSQMFDVADVPVSVANDVNWSIDALWLVGYDFGKVRGFLSGGGTYIGSELTVSGAGITAIDENTHLGWKIGPGIEIDLGNSSTLLVRANYGLHQGKKYTGSTLLGGMDFNVDVDLEPRFFEVRVAWVYEFGSVGLSDIFKRE